jgi:diphthine-ammonia ligase
MSALNLLMNRPVSAHKMSRSTIKIIRSTVERQAHRYNQIKLRKMVKSSSTINPADTESDYMKVAVHWSGGKECCLAYTKAVEQGHDVAILLTFKYMEPYIFHSIPIMELQSKAMRTPQIKFDIKNPKDPVPEIFNALAHLKKEVELEGFVTGDIVGKACARVHQAYYELICDELDLNLIMPIKNPSGDTYDVLKEEISVGLRPIMYCVNAAYFGEDWLGRELNESSIKDLKALADRHDIDVCSEDGVGYHTMVTDAQFFKEAIEISKFSKGLYEGRTKSWLHMNNEEIFLRPK